MIYIGSDHGGFSLKHEILEYLDQKGIEYQDIGCTSEDSCDYPDFAFEVSKKVAETNGKGILICGTGIGMSMTANRYKGIRGTLCHNEYTAEMSRKHNDSNVLIIGGRVTDKETAEKILTIWLETEFEGDRHKRRIDKIDTLAESESDQ